MRNQHIYLSGTKINTVGEKLKVNVSLAKHFTVTFVVSVEIYRKRG